MEMKTPDKNCILNSVCEFSDLFLFLKPHFSIYF